MITLSNPFATSDDGIPGALPAGIYVRVLEDGAEVGLVQLDAQPEPRFAYEDVDGWHLSPCLGHGDPPQSVAEALRSAGWLMQDLVEAVAIAQAKGVSPFGG
jgi:hypothetical protein